MIFQTQFLFTPIKMLVRVADLTKTVKNSNFLGLHCVFWLGLCSAFSQAGLYFDLLASANGLYFCSSPLPERRTSPEPLQKHFWKRLWNGIWLVGKAVSVTILQTWRRPFLMWIERNGNEKNGEEICQPWFSAVYSCAPVYIILHCNG